MIYSVIYKKKRTYKRYLINIKKAIVLFYKNIFLFKISLTKYFHNMKKHLILLALFIFSANIFAQNNELSKQLIEQYKKSQEKAQRKSATRHDRMWITPLLIEVSNNWEDLNDEAKSLFKKYRSRPTLSGTEQIYTRGNFAFHFTTDGPSGEKVSSTDANSNNTPDYVETMADRFVNTVQDLYHTQKGYTIPPNDNDQHSGAYYDVYISGTEAGDWVYGYVSPESLIGDNPNSENLTEKYAKTSHMVMRNNYNGFGDVNVALSVTAAHEYMHAVQMGYNSAMSTWFMEACATWSEEFAFQGYDDNFQYLSNVFSTPDISLDAGSSYDGHWYGTWIFMQYLSEHTGNEIVKSIYEETINTFPATKSIDEELKNNWDSSLEDMLKSFSYANAILSKEETYAPYTYNRASDYANKVNLKIEKTLSYSGTDVEFNSETGSSVRKGLLRLSSEYFKLTSTENFQVELATTASSKIDVTILKFNTTDKTFAIQKSADQGDMQTARVLDNDDWTNYIVVITETNRIYPANTFRNYSFTVSEPTSGASVEENEEKQLAIYPNPASDYVTIDNLEEKSEIKLFDVSGKEVVSKTTTLSKNKIDISNLAKGVYFIKVKTGNENIKVQKIIKH